MENKSISCHSRMDNISYHLSVSHPKILFTDVLYTSIVSTEISLILEFTRGSIYPTKIGVGNNFMLNDHILHLTFYIKTLESQTNSTSQFSSMVKLSVNCQVLSKHKTDYYSALPCFETTQQP